MPLIATLSYSKNRWCFSIPQLSRLAGFPCTSVSQNTVEVDPRVSQMTRSFGYSFIKLMWLLASLCLVHCYQECTTVLVPCLDWWVILCHGITGIRYPVVALLWLPPGYMKQPTWTCSWNKLAISWVYYDTDTQSANFRGNPLCVKLQNDT